MHRTLFIDTYSHLHEFASSLAGVSRTCKIFHEPVMGLLWVDMHDSIIPPLGCVTRLHPMILRQDQLVLLVHEWPAATHSHTSSAFYSVVHSLTDYIGLEAILFLKAPNHYPRSRRVNSRRPCALTTDEHSHSPPHRDLRLPGLLLPLVFWITNDTLDCILPVPYPSSLCSARPSSIVEIYRNSLRRSHSR